jgi:hypothetical protein
LQLIGLKPLTAVFAMIELFKVTPLPPAMPAANSA